ncbi:MAG: class I SAM-dependent methyltransferase [Patescibacteria group bacterium]|nr:class I SAM-dependent methyltransferase [Patescibacteria group bacterium]
MRCRSCNYDITPFFSLGEMPLVNSFLTQEEIAMEEKFDLSIGFCPKCYLVQLINIVSPERLFRDYIYFSATSKFFLEHCRKTAKDLTKKLNLNSKSLVLEIASNDGSQLKFFQDIGIKILGIDPAVNIAELANKNGIPTLPEFFGYDFAKKLKENQNVEADLIFGANVLAHVPEIIDFVRGVKVVLKQKGTAVFEFPYLKGLIEKKFDTIYHEHVFYYSLIALKNLFQKADLEIYDVEMTPMQGGSLRIFISHPGSYGITENVKNLIAEEIKTGFDKIEIYQELNKNIQDLKNKLMNLLDEIKKAGKKVAAYSAPAKGNILLNYFGIDENYIDFIVDKAESKQGLYTPGTHLLVYPPEKINQDKPDYLLVLCWNIADEIVDQLKSYHDAGGKFIIPVPDIKIL